MQVFMPYWNFEYTKLLPYTVVKVGGGIDPTDGKFRPVSNFTELHGLTVAACSCVLLPTYNHFTVENCWSRECHLSCRGSTQSRWWPAFSWHGLGLHPSPLRVPARHE